MLPVLTVNRNVCRHSARSSITTTTTACDTTTTPSGESADSRVLPPLNVSDVMSREQLRQHTERILLHSVTLSNAHCPATSEADTVTGVVHRDASSAFTDTDVAVSDSIIDNSSDGDGENKVSEVSISVSSEAASSHSVLELV